VILLAALGELLTKDELKTFQQFTGRKTAPLADVAARAGRWQP
jgi:hypothetical protein